MALGGAVVRKGALELFADAIHCRDFIVRSDLRHAEIGNPVNLFAFDRAGRKILTVTRCGNEKDQQN
jgi:hypothetical protein